METKAPTAITVRCTGCGTETEIHSLAESFSCSFCGHHQPLNPQLRHQLGAYGRAVEQYEEMTDLAKKGADRWHSYATAPQRTALKFFALFFAVTVLTSTVGLIAKQKNNVLLLVYLDRSQVKMICPRFATGRDAASLRLEIPEVFLRLRSLQNDPCPARSSAHFNLRAVQPASLSA